MELIKGDMTKAHKFQGETEGRPLAEWLRGRPSDSRRRIETLLRLFLEVLRIEREMRERHGWKGERMLGKLGIHYSHERAAEVEKLRRGINKRLACYRGYRSFVGQVPADERVRLMFFAASKTIKADEVRSYNAITSLMAQGLLSRMRECQQCGRWYFARFETQRSCQAGCRVRFAQSKPEWREKHNKYRRDNYKIRKILQRGKR
jgi:hypothetical protein